MLLFAPAWSAQARNDADADFPLHDVAVRDAVSLNGVWDFRRDPENRGAREAWYRNAPDDWATVPVPGVWEDAPGNITPPIDRGRGWFRRRVVIPATWDGDVAIAFLGAMHVADVWVNGQYVGVHRGGYTPFLFDVTRFVEAGQAAALVVRVDNTSSEVSIPKDATGWDHHGGLYRDVYLLHRPPVRIEDLAVRTRVDVQQRARVTVSAVMTNTTATAWNGPVRLVLRADGRGVGTGETTLSVGPARGTAVAFTIDAGAARLWSTTDPYLHALEIAWGTGPRETLTMPVGLRELRIDGHALYLNNARLWLQGFGRHEDLAGYGPCIPYDVREAELRLMRDTFNCNFLRPGHYPNHPHLYNLCDRIGVLVFSEIPVWQMPAYVVQSERCWQRWLRPQLEEMVASQRNHPSVAFWGIANETYETHDYFRRATRYLDDRDPTRAATAALAATHDLPASRFFDAVARNYHYGWYHSRRVYKLREGLARTVQAAPDKPILVSELGGHATRGRLTGSYGDRARGSETYLDMILRFGLGYCFTESDHVAGASVWSWTDFWRENHIERHGVFDHQRRPKLAAYTVCNAYAAGPRLFVCERDAHVPRGDSWHASIRFFNPSQEPLDGYTAAWALMRGTNRFAEGSAPVPVTVDRAGEIETVSWTADADAPAGMYTLWVQLFDADGRRRHTACSRFDYAASSPPGLLRATLAIDGTPAAGWARYGGIMMPVYAVPGLLLPLPPGEHTITFGMDGHAPQERTVTLQSGGPPCDVHVGY